MADNNLIRITNCLQTILELEPVLERLDLGKPLLEEFEVLKNFLADIDEVELSEEDVERIERATANFLEELRGPLEQKGGEVKSMRRLQ